MITVYQGNADTTGHGNFTFNGPIATLAPTVQGVVTMVPTALALADFDGDNKIDIVAVSPGIPAQATDPYPEGQVFEFKGLGNGQFALPNQVNTGGVNPINVQAADVNGDGLKDLVIANAGDPGPINSLTYSWTGNSIGVMLNFSAPGSIQFDFATPLTLNIRGVFATAVADFNLDGKMDIAAVNYGAPSTGFDTPKNAFVTVYLGSTTNPGQFATATPAEYDTQTGAAGGQYLAVGDFDGNTTPDLIVVHDNNQVDLLMNAATPAATRPAVTAVDVNAGQANTDQRSRVTSLKVTFNTQVTFAQPGNVGAAFQINRIGGGSVGGFTATAAVQNNVTVVTLTAFTGAETEFLSLADGLYNVTVVANQVSSGGLALDGNGDGTSGDNYSLNGTIANKLFRYFGDVNGDGFVSGGDFTAFRLAFGSIPTDGSYVDYLDFNGGGISGGDFTQFRLRFGLPLVP